MATSRWFTFFCSLLFLGCNLYRPGASAVTSPYAANTHMVGIDADDAAEDLFLQRFGVVGHCVRGRVASDGPLGGPVAHAEIEFTAEASGRSTSRRTAAGHLGEFGFCLPKKEPHVARLRVSVQAPGYLPSVIEARDLRPGQMPPLLAVLKPLPAP